MTHMGIDVIGARVRYSGRVVGEIEFDKARCGSYNSIVEVEL